MSTLKSLLQAFGLLCLAAASLLAWADSERTGDDQTLSPYFLITTPDADLDAFALKDTRVEANIAGVIAEVKVTQVYQNQGRQPLEAIYVFPASSRAAVYGMKMTIGARTVVARIEKRDQARAEYERARSEGRSASLLEQQRPNVFQMNVANILPGDEITVEMEYAERLIPTRQVYEFVYPTVVGPRYSNRPAATAPAGERWVQNPTLSPGTRNPTGFGLTVHLAAGVPVQEIASPSHKVNVAYAGPTQATVTLDPAEPGGNRDFILNYRLAGSQVEAGLLLYAGETENFFLLTVQPPAQVVTAQIPPREYVFVMDVSGSMEGFPLETAKRLFGDLLGQLRPRDRFNVVLFAGSSAVLADRSLPATPEHRQQALKFVNTAQGGGGTELLPALQSAFALPRAEGLSRTVVVVTDGYVDAEKETFALIRRQLGHANLFAFGIGTAVNRFLIEGMARAGMGEPFVITAPDQAPTQAAAFQRLLATPVLTDLQVRYEGFDATEIDPPQIPDVFAERPIVVVGQWRGEPQGQIVVTGRRGDQPYRQTLSVADSKPSPANGALRLLWARQRIAGLEDDNQLAPNAALAEQITALGLQYHLLTAYTAFVAVDSQVRLQDGTATTVTQPLPLPEGVPPSAIGGSPRALAARAASPVEASKREHESGAKIRQEAARAAYQNALEQQLLQERQRQLKGAAARTAVRAKQRTASVQLTAVTVERGALTEAAIRQAFAQDARISRCVAEIETAITQRHLPLTLMLTLVLRVDAEGQVTFVRPKTLDPLLTPCLIRAIGQWHLPAGDRAALVRLDVKITLTTDPTPSSSDPPSE